MTESVPGPTSGDNSNSAPAVRGGKGLSGRLSQLSTQATGQPSEPPATPPSNGTLERLRATTRLRGSGGNARPLPPKSKNEPALAEQLGAELLAPGLLRVVTRIPAGSPHGTCHLEKPTPVAMGHFGAESEIPPIAIDTETTGLSGGTGTVPFLIGLARQAETTIEITQYVITQFKGESEMLLEVASMLDTDSPLLSYNGKPFDIPLLRTRYRLHHLPDPFSPHIHLDLLPAVRRAYARRWPNCSLTRAERELLGFVRQGDIPGNEIPDVWTHLLRTGQPGRLAEVIAHNRDDLISLYILPNALYRAINAPARTGAAGTAAAEEHLRRGERRAALNHLKTHMSCLDERGQRLLARLAEREGDRELAIGLWREMAVRDDPEALERLAVHYEHRAPNVSKALELVERLLIASDYSAERRAQHERRHTRLLRKAAAKDALTQHR